MSNKKEVKQVEEKPVITAEHLNMKELSSNFNKKFNTGRQ